MFFVGQRGAFAGSSSDDEGVHALRDLPVDETFECRIVDAAGGQRSDEGGRDTAEDRIGSHNTVSFCSNMTIYCNLRTKNAANTICICRVRHPVFRLPSDKKAPVGIRN